MRHAPPEFSNMSASPSKPPKFSLGRLFLPARLHERFQLERYHVCQFLRENAIPLLKPGMKVLDAGSGHLAEQVMREELLATGISLTTIDMNPGPGVDFTGDVSAMPFEDAAYDVVICTQVMEHVQSPERTCRELVRVLKPGGILFATAPQSAPLHNIPWHYFNPTKFGWKLLMEQNQMEVVAIKPQGAHFSQLATALHYTVPVIEQSSMPGWLKMPASLLARALFGFVAKLILVPLDRYDTQARNAGGWCVHARKPLA